MIALTVPGREIRQSSGRTVHAILHLLVDKDRALLVQGYLERVHRTQRETRKVEPRGVREWAVHTVMLCKQG